MSWINSRLQSLVCATYIHYSNSCRGPYRLYDSKKNRKVIVSFPDSTYYWSESLHSRTLIIFILEFAIKKNVWPGRNIRLIEETTMRVSSPDLYHISILPPRFVSPQTFIYSYPKSLYMLSPIGLFEVIIDFMIKYKFTNHFRFVSYVTILDRLFW